MEAKREDTRARRFVTLLECSAKGERIPFCGGGRGRTARTDPMAAIKQ
jgi:hypothetical protein